MKKNYRYSSNILALASCVLPLFAVLMYFKVFFDEIITRNPMFYTVGVTGAFVTAFIIPMIYNLAISKIKKQGSFANWATFLVGLLTICLGLATPHRFNLLLSKTYLLVQTVDIMVSVVSAVILIAIIAMTALGVCSTISRFSKCEHSTKERLMSTGILVAFCIFSGLIPMIANKLGYANMYMLTGGLVIIMSACNGLLLKRKD